MTEIKISELPEVTSLVSADLLEAVRIADGINGSKKITVGNFATAVLTALISTGNAGDMIYATGSNTLTRLPISTAGRLMVAGASAPTWSTKLSEGTITGLLTLSKTGSTAREATFPDAAIIVAGINLAQSWTAAQTFDTETAFRRSSDAQITFQSNVKRSAANAQQYKANWNSNGVGTAYYLQILDGANAFYDNPLYYDYTNKRIGLGGLITPEATLHTGGAIIASGTGAAGRYIRSVYIPGASGSDAIQIQGRTGGTSGWVHTITTTALTANRTLTLPDADVTLSGSASALSAGRLVLTTTGGLLTTLGDYTWSATTPFLSLIPAIPAGFSSDQIGVLIRAIALAQTSSSALSGLVAQARTGSSNVNTTLFGTVPTISIDTGASGAMNWIAALRPNVAISATSAMTFARVAHLDVNANGATFGGAAHVITALYGIAYLPNTLANGTTIGTHYGLHISNINDASINYAIYTNAGILRFGDATEATTTSDGSVRLLGGISVVKAGVFGGSVRVADGTVAAPGIRLTSEATGLYRVSSTEIGISVAGAYAASFTAPIAATRGGALFLASTATTEFGWLAPYRQDTYIQLGGSYGGGASDGGIIRCYGSTHASNPSHIRFAHGATLAATLISGIFTLPVASGTTLVVSSTNVDSATFAGGAKFAKCIGVGNVVYSYQGITIQGVTLSGGTTHWGINVAPTYGSDATSAIRGISSNITTAVASFTCANAYAFHVVNPTIGAGSAITVFHGYYCEALSGPGTSYAFRSAGAGIISFGDTTAATTTSNGSVRLAGGLSVIGAGVFGGKITGPACTASLASFNVPHGTAPSSPVDGDIWSTTNGLFVKINTSNRKIMTIDTAYDGMLQASSSFSHATSNALVTIDGSLATLGGNYFLMRSGQTAGLLEIAGGAGNTDGGNIQLYGSTHATATKTVRIRSESNIRIEANATGLGFFAATPVAKPTVTGSRGGNAALASLLTALANLGLLTDSSS